MGTLRQWRDRIRSNQATTARRFREMDSTAEFSEAEDVAEPTGMNLRADRHFYDDLLAGVQRRTELVNHIARNLEDPDLELSPETRVRLQDELRNHQRATQNDLMLLRRQSSNSSRFPNPGDENPNFDAMGTNSTLSSNNTAVDMGIQELARGNSMGSIADEVDRILGGVDDIPI